MTVLHSAPATAVINKFAAVFAEFEAAQAKCAAENKCGPHGEKTGSKIRYVPYADSQGAIRLAALQGVTPNTPGGKLLYQAEYLQSYLDTLPLKEAQLVGLGVQAVMGPVKMAVGLAGNVLVDKLFGEKIAAVKDNISKGIASDLTGIAKSELEKSDATLKNVYKYNNDSGQPGDVYVRGAATLLNIALGTITNVSGSAIGAVGGKIGAGGPTKIADDLKIDLKHPDWNKELGLDPKKGWADSGPYSSRDIRNEFVSQYGKENVKSTTVPPLNMSNVKLAGQHKTINLPDGTTVRVVFDQKGFPIFDDFAKFDTRLNIEKFRGKSYAAQLRMATRNLRSEIALGNVSASGFGEVQLKAIKGGFDKIPGYTWHHHQDTGRMQLVPEAIHGGARHVGWESMNKGQ